MKESKEPSPLKSSNNSSIKSAIDGVIYYRSNGGFSRHLKANGITEQEYAHKYISDGTCEFCNQRLRRLRPDMSWAPSCGKLCRGQAIAKKKLELYSDPLRRVEIIEKFQAGFTIEKREAAKMKIKLSMTPESLQAAKEKRRATCNEIYGDPTYSNSQQISKTKRLFSQSKISSILKKTAETNIKRYGNLSVFNGHVSSKFERDAIELLEARGINGRSYKSKFGQLSIETNGSFYLYDFEYNKQIIEFHGDFWHGNPAIFEADDIIGRGRQRCKAIDRWKLDKKRMATAINNDYQIMIVWESEFYNDQQATIDRCVAWLI